MDHSTKLDFTLPRTQSSNSSKSNSQESFDPQSIEASETIIAQAKQVLSMEAQAILGIQEKLGLEFEKAINLLLGCCGKVVVTGIGKSGHIGSKLAATFASTGTPAFFVHPAELRHGDFGMLDEKDLLVALSGSGETTEIKIVLDPIKRLGIKIIALTGNPDSTLATVSDVALDVGVDREACPLNLAPTSSTAATLAMGDALAIVLMTKKGIKAEDFARSHPGGNLGQKLITVKDIMRSGVEIPSVPMNSPYKDVLSEINDKKLGFTTVCTENGSLKGIITDGDLRRAAVRWQIDVFDKLADEIMTRDPKTIAASALAVEALKLMEKHSISALLTLDQSLRPIGLIHLKDLLRAGII